jgi:hypothetical protein
VGQKSFDRARSQDRAKRETHIGCAQVFKHDKGQRVRQALPAESGWPVNRSPATFDIGLIGSFEPRWHRDFPIHPLGIVRIADPVERRPFSRRNRARALEDRIDHIRRCFRKGSMPGQFGNAGHGVENETLFGYWWCVGHISLYRWLA